VKKNALTTLQQQTNNITTKQTGDGIVS